jgi:ribosomal-protein-alanine N-acetyltransferase
MPEIQLLRLDHAPALLVFEQENREYFAASIPDRGDDYFMHFDERHQEFLAHQADGTDYFHVILDSGGEVLCRINLDEIEDGSAELGFRIAEKAANQGLATAAAQQILVLAAGYGLTMLRARTTLDNHGSRTVLARTGFTVVGETVLNGRPGLRFERSLRDLG